MRIIVFGATGRVGRCAVAHADFHRSNVYPARWALHRAPAPSGRPLILHFLDFCAKPRRAQGRLPDRKAEMETFQLPRCYICGKETKLRVGEKPICLTCDAAGPEQRAARLTQRATEKPAGQHFSTEADMA